MTDDNRWRNQDEHHHRMRDDDDRDRSPDRDPEHRGMGQSGYGAGRSADDRSIGTSRNAAWSGRDDRYDESRRWDEGRRWEEGRMGMSQGYGYQDGDRPTFGRTHDPRGFVSGAHDPRNDPRYGDEKWSTGYGDREHQTGFGAHGPDLRQGPHRGKGPKGFEPSDDRIRERVCEALCDDHNIDASNIEVSIHRGEVTLTGTVDDRNTKRMAEDCALQCSGVRDVHNQLRVRA